MSDQFDVFLSHQSGDAPWVAKLKSALEHRGVKVWLDQEQIRPGDLFIDALEQGIQSSGSLALIISPGALRSLWVREEYQRALVISNSKQRELRLIPVLLQDTDLPGFLSTRQWVDFREPENFEQSVGRLVWGITGNRSSGLAESATATGLTGLSVIQAPETRSRVDEVGYLERFIQREDEAIRKLTYLRLAAPVTGLTVWGIIAVTMTGLNAPANVMLALGTPTITALIGFAATAREWTGCHDNKKRLTNLRDGLELCRNMLNTQCNRLLEVFWKTVEESAGSGGR
jgi:hypothetical protein